MKQYSIFALTLALVFLPIIAFGSSHSAAIGGATPLGDIGNTFLSIKNFINSILIPLVFAIALLVFLWGIFKYLILGGGDESKRAEGRQLMLYSILAFVLMVAIFGIVNLVIGGLGLDKKNENIKMPSVPTQRS